MENVNPVGWFEIPTRNIIRAKDFYEAIFDKVLYLDEIEDYKMAWFPKKVNNEYGATGALIESDDYTPSHNGTLVYFSVPRIEDTLKRIEKNGGRILQAKKNIGKHGSIAKFEDCEGNCIALHSMS